MPVDRNSLDSPTSPLVRGYFVPYIEPTGSPPITLFEVWQWMSRAWKILLVSAAAGLLAGVAAGLILPPIYQAQVVASPVKESAGGASLGGIAAQFGGLASIAGLDLNLAGDSVEAVAVLRSRSLAEQFVRDESLLIKLFASKWDETQGRWDLMPWQQQPTVADAVAIFDRKIRFVEEDRRTGLVTLTIRWVDAEQAARWANELVRRANSRLQAVAIEQSRQNIEFLQGLLENTTVIGVRESIFRLIESELRRGMLASTRPEFAFHVIDPGVVPEPHQFVAPKRGVLVLAGSILGLLLGITIAVIRGLRARGSNAP